MVQKIIIAIEGDAEDHGHVRMERLSDYLNSLGRALDYAARHAAVDGKKNEIYYRVVDAHHSRTTFAFEPVAVDDDLEHSRTNATIFEFNKRLHEIQTGSVTPDVTAEELEAYRELAPAPKNHIRRVTFTFDAPAILKPREYELTDEFHSNIEELLGPEEVAWGTMAGKLEALNLHERNVFYLYPAIGPTRVKCLFERDLRDAVAAAALHYVEAAGKIHYRQRYKFPHLMTGVYRLETLDLDPTRPTLSALRGISPGATDGLDTRDFVDGLDEEW